MSIQDSTVREMLERVIELTRSYAVWWTLVNKEDFDRHAKVLDHHQDFFATTINSLFLNFSVITYQLFERRKDTTSIPSLIESLAPSKLALRKQLTDRIDANRKVLAKVFSIRSNVYAHRSKLRPPERFFATSNLTPAEMESVVFLAQDIIAAIADAEGIEAKADTQAEIRLRDQYSREDTRLVMESLGSKLSNNLAQ